MTLQEIKEHLKDLDTDTLIDMLNITSEDIVEYFDDRIEENYVQLKRELG